MFGQKSYEVNAAGRTSTPSCGIIAFAAAMVYSIGVIGLDLPDSVGASLLKI
jgi:hypothetical protein